MTEQSHRAIARLPGLPVERMREYILAGAREYDMRVVEDGAGGLRLDTDYGWYFLDSEENIPVITIDAPRVDWLHVLKDSIVGGIAEIAPEVAAGIRWSDSAQAGTEPPNMHWGVVQAVEDLSETFLRVTLRIGDPGRFGGEAIHFRLLLPPAAIADPVYPVIGENGATLWPKKEKSLHCPAYTIRSQNDSEGEIRFDIFIHPGGRATAWAQAAEPGTRVALMGPGGGGLLDAAGPVLLYGDETAFPAIARILENLPDTATGKVTLRAKGQGGYPMPARAGFTITWIDPASADLAAIALAERAAAPEHFLWFAAQKPLVQKLRAAVKAQPGTTRNHYIAAYW